MLNNDGGDVLKGLNLLEIGEFLRNKSALYREAFFLFELQKGYCFCLYLNNETGGFVLRKCVQKGPEGARQRLRVVEQRKEKYKWRCL